MNKETLKRYAISSLITFLTGFLLVIGGEIDTLTLDSLKDGSLAGLLLLALRAGVKAFIEYVVPVLGTLLAKLKTK